MSNQGATIQISGIVQGVGFRPFVYGLANRLNLTGWVRNTSAGVEICIDGPETNLHQFIHSLQAELPPLARIDSLELSWQPDNGFTAFEILQSEAITSAFQPISPDICICNDCLKELFDPNDRRYRYPFINCTNCGPRFTIIQDIPYDRPKTSMAGFQLCASCTAEYQNPLDRRFHAQPVACPNCGPQVWLESSGYEGHLAETEAAIQSARNLLLDGKILAIKGLGGFHLACDATNSTAVAKLRTRKLRVGKPFAVMFPSITSVLQHCEVTSQDTTLLESRQRPIVILNRLPTSTISSEVAPGQDTLGAMLPYTPLHYLLLTHPDLPPLVMTSGNLAEEPICTDNREARQRLASLADYFLMHDRPIEMRCDDSVTRSGVAAAMILRRSRGFAPDPLRLPFEIQPILATGAELKNTFCVARQRYAFLSHHIGDLENYPALQAFESGIQHYQRLFRVQPEAIAYDLHPDYLATRYALQRAEAEQIPAVGIQHHHAHIAACMAENGLPSGEQVIGVAWDGTGYGDDGAIWGSEFLLASYPAYRRIAHLTYVPLPGGDLAARQPWRMALAWLHKSGIPWEGDLAPVQFAAEKKDSGFNRLQVLRHQLESSLNSPPTSSMGRLFDAVAAMIGIRQEVSYEAQAAIEMEALADPIETGIYSLDIKDDGIIDPIPLWQALLADIRLGIAIPILCARFHNSLANLVAEICQGIRQQAGVNRVALSGGVWQNKFLLDTTYHKLDEQGFDIYLHNQVPTNDGGLALGQAMAAAAQLANQDRSL